MRIVKITLLAKLLVLHHLSVAGLQLVFLVRSPLLASCIQIYVSLNVLVNFKVECTSQRDWGWGCALWGRGGDGIQMYGDGVGMEKKSWGWGRNGADFQYRVTL